MRQVCTSSAWPPGTSITLPLSCKASRNVRRLTCRNPHQLTRSRTSCTTHSLSHELTSKHSCSLAGQPYTSLHSSLQELPFPCNVWCQYGLLSFAGICLSMVFWPSSAECESSVQASWRNEFAVKVALTGVKKSTEATRVAGTMPGSS